MLKGHQSYLRRIIGIAAANRTSGRILDKIGRIRTIETPVYQLLRDIVCDIRFYSVIDDDPIWKDYATSAISEFYDSLTEDDWLNDEQRTGKKEDFLNAWFASHIMPMTVRGRVKMEQELRYKRQRVFSETSDPENDSSISREIVDLTDGINDLTEINAGVYINRTNGMSEINMYARRNNAPGVRVDSYTSEIRFLDSINPELLELAKKIGRKGSEESIEVRGRFKTASRSDISGVTMGDNLNNLLPTELAMLSTPSSEKIFLQRYVQKRLQVFSSASSSKGERLQKAGPIYICVDTSGSMHGEPELMAKSLALAISIIAQQEKRPVCMVNYSDDLSYFILIDLQRQRKQFLSFLSCSYGGGNDENKLFNFLFKILPKIPQYRQFANAFKGADLLVISDFFWSCLLDETKKLLSEARLGGMKFYGLKINEYKDFDEFDMSLSQENIEEIELFDEQQEETPFDEWTDFFLNCDYRYEYYNGHIREYKERRIKR